jgi:hypothetical protein
MCSCPVFPGKLRSTASAAKKATGDFGATLIQARGVRAPVPCGKGPAAAPCTPAARASPLDPNMMQWQKEFLILMPR